MPLIVTGSEVSSVFTATSVLAVNENASGVTSASVVTVNVALTPPTVTVTSIGVLVLSDAMVRIVKVWPLLMVPAAVVKPPRSIAYSPPAMEIAVAVLMPVISTAGETTAIPGSALVTPEKAKVFGVASGGATELELATLLEATAEETEELDIAILFELEELEPPPPPPPQPTNATALANNKL